MRVSNRMVANNFLYHFMRNEEKLNQKGAEISSGRRINNPSDDPIGSARSMSIHSSLNEISQYSSNTNEAMSFLNATDDALTSVYSMLQRAYGLAVSGGSSDKPSSSHEAMAEEIDNIKDGIFQLANTSIDNRYIFAGTEVVNPPYTKRAVATGNALKPTAQPVVITQNNNQFKLKLDDGPTRTITLPSGTWDGSTGHTLTDLAKTIQKQFDTAGFNMPVYAKATPDQQILFYAGERPSDGTPHTLVLKSGPAIKETGAIRAQAGIPANQVVLGMNANTTDNYYNGWTMTITGGTGAGQVRKIAAFNGTAQTATLDSNWDIPLDSTSTYSIQPPLEGISSGATESTVSFDPGNSSSIDGFYTGMKLTITNGPGSGESKKIIAYDAATHTATLESPPPWTTLPSGSSYVITPDIKGTVQAVTTTSVTLGADASNINNFYNGSSITVTNASGTREARRIVAYNGITKEATLEGTGWNHAPSVTSTYEIADTALADLGFENQTTTKELLSTPINGTILALGNYPYVGHPPATTGANDLTLSNDTRSQPDFYKNWKVRIISGTGAGQMRTVSTYDPDHNSVTVDSDWAVKPDKTSQYELTPPLTGAVAGTADGANQIQLSDASQVKDFYKGMLLTISDGKNTGETRTITAYDPETQIATVDPAWTTPPDATSRYAINANDSVASNNKFKITVGFEPTQEISLDAGQYSLPDFAKELEIKIRERGGEYANIRVTTTPSKQLRIFYQDPDLDDKDQPLNIKLEAGSKADILASMGFSNNDHSEMQVPNYEGDQNGIDYEINFGTKVQVNSVGDRVFDSIFQHLTKISQDLRAGNANSLGNDDLRHLQEDMDKILLSRSECGAKVNRLQTGLDRLGVLHDNFTTLLSNIEDVDITQAAIDLQTRQLAYQAALQAGAKIMPVSLLDYLR